MFHCNVAGKLHALSKDTSSADFSEVSIVQPSGRIMSIAQMIRNILTTLRIMVTELSFLNSDFFSEEFRVFVFISKFLPRFIHKIFYAERNGCGYREHYYRSGVREADPSPVSAVFINEQPHYYTVRFGIDVG